MSAASLAARLSAGRHALHTLHMVARLPAAVLCCSEGGSARRDVDCARARAGAEGGGGGCVCKGGQEEHGKKKNRNSQPRKRRAGRCSKRPWGPRFLLHRCNTSHIRLQEAPPPPALACHNSLSN